MLPMSRRVFALVRLCMTAAIAGAANAANAESLRCEGSSAVEGDSKLSVLYKCGPPLLKDTYCDAVYTPQSTRPVPEPFASAFAPCMPIEEWIYDRGPGNLVATVRFRSGVVRSIVYGRTPH